MFEWVFGTHRTIILVWTTSAHLWTMRCRFVFSVCWTRRHGWSLCLRIFNVKLIVLRYSMICVDNHYCVTVQIRILHATNKKVEDIYFFWIYYFILLWFVVKEKRSNLYKQRKFLPRGDWGSQTKTLFTIYHGWSLSCINCIDFCLPKVAATNLMDIFFQLKTI